MQHKKKKELEIKSVLQTSVPQRQDQIKEAGKLLEIIKEEQIEKENVGLLAKESFHDIKTRIQSSPLKRQETYDIRKGQSFKSFNKKFSQPLHQETVSNFSLINYFVIKRREFKKLNTPSIGYSKHKMISSISRDNILKIASDFDFAINSNNYSDSPLSLNQKYLEYINNKLNDQLISKQQELEDITKRLQDLKLRYETVTNELLEEKKELQLKLNEYENMNNYLKEKLNITNKELGNYKVIFNQQKVNKSLNPSKDNYYFNSNFEMLKENIVLKSQVLKYESNALSMSNYKQSRNKVCINLCSSISSKQSENAANDKMQDAMSFPSYKKMALKRVKLNPFTTEQKIKLK